MAEQVASLSIGFVSDLSAAKKQWEDFIAQVEGRKVNVPIGAATGSVGGPAAAQAGNVAQTSFGNPSTGTAFTVANQPAGRFPITSGLDPSTIAQSASIARNVGASLAMQNGSPGASFGGITSMAGQPSAPQIVQQNATARAANPWFMPGASAEWNNSGRLPRDVSYDMAAQYSAFSRTNTAIGGHGAIPSFPELPPASSRYRSTPRERVGSGWSWPAGGGLVRYSPPPSYGGIPASDADIIDAEWEPTVGGGSVPPASVNVPSAMTTGKARDRSLRGILSRYAAFGAAVGTLSGIANAAAAYGDVGANPQGSAASIDTRNQLARFNAIFGGAKSLPILGGFLNFEESATNYALGRGFVSEDARLGRRATLEERGREAIILRRRADANDDINRTYDTPRQIELRRLDDIEAARSELRGQAELRDVSDPSGLNQTGRSLLDSRLRIINSNAARGMRDYGVGLDTSYRSAEVDRRVGVAQVNRDHAAELYESTYGRAFALPGTTDPGVFKAAVYGAGVNYRSGRALLERENREGVIDNFADYQSGALSRAGETRLGDRNRITANRDRLKRMFGTSGLFSGVRAAIDAAAEGQLQDADIADEGRGYASSGLAYSTGRTLANDPQGAHTGAIAARFLQQRGHALPGSTDYQRAQSEAVSALSADAYQRDTQRSLVGISQRFENLSLDAIGSRNGRDPFGAQAYQTAGETIARAMQLQRTVGDAAATEERRLGQRRIAQERRDYLNGFRGEEFNPRTTAVSPRDRENVGETLARFADASRRTGQSNDAGGFGNGQYTGPSKEDLQKMLETAVKAVIDGLQAG